MDKIKLQSIHGLTSNLFEIFQNLENILSNTDGEAVFICSYGLDPDPTCLETFRISPKYMWLAENLSREDIDFYHLPENTWLITNDNCKNWYVISLLEALKIVHTELFNKMLVFPEWFLYALIKARETYK